MQCGIPVSRRGTAGRRHAMRAPSYSAPREGTIEGFSLGNSMLWVDYTAWLYRQGKATLTREVDEILDRFGSNADHLGLHSPFVIRHRLGRFFATTRKRFRDAAERLGLRRIPNLGGCPASRPCPTPGDHGLWP